MIGNTSPLSKFFMTRRFKPASGPPVIDEETMAMDFLHKLDLKRFDRMLNNMRRNALCDAEESYPATPAAAVRVASAWPDEGPSSTNPNPSTHSAFLTADSAFETKSTDPGSKKQGKNPPVDKSPSGKKKSLAEMECYVCGEFGHYAMDCKDRKAAGKALVTKSNDSAVDEEGYEKDDEEESVYVTTSETVLFSKHDVPLDSQASVNIFCNSRLLKNVRKSDRQVLLNGVQSGASGVRVTQEGDFEDIGKVYFSAEATANILSYAVMVDEGNSVSYNQLQDRFELRPVGSNLVYSFCRKNVRGSEGRFYCCDVRSMIGSYATVYPTVKGLRIVEHALNETESENM